eukprot:g66409.t1
MSSHSESAFPRGGRQGLDLARILELSNESKKAVEVSGEGDAIILLGITGCGKTTATHYLGGGTMILYSPDGITRKRVECKDQFEGAQIGFGAASVTRYVKAFRAIPEYGNVWLVDPPGILDSAGPEVDIANAVGTQYAFRLVKSARPVLLLNINELIVARARSVVQVIKVLNDWFHPIQDYYPDYLTIFFTHLTEDDKAQAVRNMLHVLKEVATTLNYKTLPISEEEAADLKYLIEKLLEVAERIKEDCILFPYPPTQPAHYLKLLLQKEPIPRNKLVQTIPISQENKTVLSNQCGNLLFESQDHLENDEFQELEKKLDVLRGLMEGTGLSLLEDKYKEITGKVEAAFDNQLKSLRSSLAKQNYQVAKHLLALKAMGCLSKHVTGDRRGAFENAKKDLEDHMLELGEAAKDGKQPVATVAGSLDCMRHVHQHLQDFLRKGVAEDYYNSLRCLLERLQVRFETAKRVIGTLEAQDFAIAKEGLTNEPFPAGFKSPEAMVHLGFKPAFPEGQTVDVLEAALADLKQLAVMEAHRAATVQHPTTQVSFAEAMGWYGQCTDRLCKLLEACARRVLDKKLAARLEKEPAARLVHDVFILSQLYQNANMEVHVEAQIIQLNLALHDLGETGSQQLVQLRQRLFGVGGQQSMTAQQGPETSDDADHKDFQVDEFAGLGGSLRAVAVICCCSFEHVQKVRSECSELLVDMDAALRRVAQEAQQRWDRASYPTLQDHEFLARCLSQLMSAAKELRPLRVPADASGNPHLRTELPADYTHFAKEMRRRCREDIQVVVREILQWLGLVHYFHASTVLSRLLRRQPVFKLVLHKPHALKAVQAEITSLWKAWEDQINRLQRVWENKAHVKKAVIAYLHEDAAACLQEDGEASPGVAVSSVGKPYAGELNGKAGEPQEEASKQETYRREILMRVQREMDAKAAVLPSASHGEALFYIYVTQRQYFGIVQGGLSKLSESVNKPVDELRAQLHRSREGLTQHIKDFLGKAEQDLSAKLAGCDFATVKDGMEELASFFLFERYETEFAAPAKKATQNLQQQLEKLLEQLLNTAVRHLNVPNYPACEAIIERLEGAKPLDAAFGKGGLAKQLEKLKVDHAARKNNLDQHMNEYLNCNQFSKILAIVKPFKDAADQTLFLKYNAIVCTYLRDRINLDKLSPPRFFWSRQEDENQDDQLLNSAFNILTMCQSAMVLNDVLEGFQLAAELANIAKRIDDRFRAREAKLSKFMGMFEYTKAVHVFGQLERFKKFDDVWHELWPQPTVNSQPIPAAAADRAVPSRQDRPVHPGDIKRGAQKEDMRRNEKKGTNKAQATPAFDAKAVYVHERTNKAKVAPVHEPRPIAPTTAIASGRHFTDWLAKIDRKHFRQLRDKTIPLIQRLLGPSLSEGKRQEGEGEPGEPSLGVTAGAVDNLNLSSDLSFVDTILKNSQEAQIELAHNEVDLSGSEFVDLHGAVKGLLKMEWQKCQAAVKKAVGDSDISTALRQIAVARSLMTCKLLSSLHNKRFTELEENVIALVNQPEELTAENVAKVCERLHRLRYDGDLRAFLQEQKTIKDYFGSLARTVRDYMKSATWTNTAQQKTAKALALFDAYVLRLQEGNLKDLSKKLAAEVRELRQDLLEAVKEQLDKVGKARECKDWPTSLAAMQYLDQVFKSPARLVGEGSEEGAKLKQKYEELTNTLVEQEDGLKKAARFLKGLDFLRAGVDAKQFWGCLDTIQSEAGVLRVGSSHLSYAKCEEELQLRLNQAVEEAKEGLRTGRNTKLSPRQMVEADDAEVEEEKLHVYSALQILLRNLEELFTRTLARESRHPIVVNAAKQARDQLVRPIREKLDKSGQVALQLCKQKNFKALEPIWEDLRQLETAIKEFSALFGDMPVDSLIKHITADIDQQFQAFYAQQDNGLNELAIFIVNVIKNTHEISQKEVQAHTDEQVRNCLKRYHSKVSFFELAETLSLDEVGEELVSSGSYPEFQAAVIKKTNDLMAKIYPNDKFKFDEQKDVVCLPDRTHFFEMLALDANKRREAARPVLIFFHSDKALEDFMDSEYGKRIPEIRSLREDTYNFPHALRCAVKPGQVTCLPAVLGRGIDFKCNSREVEDAGGVHVIQAFFSMDLSEERQIKGRTARQTASGSYQLILCVEDLKALELTALQIQQAGNQLYATLATARKAYVQKLAEKRKLQGCWLSSDIRNRCAISNMSRCVCVTSTQSSNLAWIQSFTQGGGNATASTSSAYCMFAMQPILTESSEFSWADRAKIHLGCRVLLVETLARFHLRNPLEMYVAAKPYVDSDSTRILLLNGTCEDLTALVDDTRTGCVAECRHMRQQTFRAFENMHVRPVLSRAQPVDVPQLDSPEALLQLLWFVANTSEASSFSNKKGEAAGSSSGSVYDNGKALQQLHELAAANPSSKCLTKSVGGIFPRFQFALLGLHGAGKSTFLYWLASHLQLAEEVKNAFAFSKSGVSYTRSLIQASLRRMPTPNTTIISDTMGLPGHEEKWLCDIHRILEGRVTPRQAMDWVGCDSRWGIGRVKEWTGMAAPAPVAAPHQEHEVHAFVFFIPANEENQTELREFVKQLKMKNLHTRIVFAVSRATEIEVKRVAGKVGVSELDIFPLNTAATKEAFSPSEVFIPPHLYLPILRRLQEKACRYYALEAPERTSKLAIAEEQGLFIYLPKLSYIAWALIWLLGYIAWALIWLLGYIAWALIWLLGFAVCWLWSMLTWRVCLLLLLCAHFPIAHKWHRAPPTEATIRQYLGHDSELLIRLARFYTKLARVTVQRGQRQVRQQGKRR